MIEQLVLSEGVEVDLDMNSLKISNGEPPDISSSCNQKTEVKIQYEQLCKDGDDKPEKIDEIITFDEKPEPKWVKPCRLETIFEEPLNKKVMGAMKFARSLNFRENNPLKLNKRSMKAKKITASTRLHVHSMMKFDRRPSGFYQKKSKRDLKE